MKRLLLVRHGKPEPKEARREDVERELAEEGRLQARSLGKKLSGRGLRPDLVLCSSAARARETAAIIVAELHGAVELREVRELYATDASRYLRVLGEVEKGDFLVLVGHNPAVEDLASLLAGHRVELKTCSAADLSLDLASWTDLSAGSRAGRLALITPEEGA